MNCGVDNPGLLDVGTFFLQVIDTNHDFDVIGRWNADFGHAVTCSQDGVLVKDGAAAEVLFAKQSSQLKRNLVRKLAVGCIFATHDLRKQTNFGFEVLDTSKAKFMTGQR